MLRPPHPVDRPAIVVMPEQSFLDHLLTYGVLFLNKSAPTLSLRAQPLVIIVQSMEQAQQAVPTLYFAAMAHFTKVAGLDGLPADSGQRLPPSGWFSFTISNRHYTLSDDDAAPG